MENLNLSKYAKKQFYKENDLISVRIDFGGFYDSIHDSRIEGDIESFSYYSESILLDNILNNLFISKLLVVVLVLTISFNTFLFFTV